MTTDTKPMETMIDSLAERAKCYLTNEMAIDVANMRKAIDGVHTVTLEHLTAVIGVGGPAGVLVAFSYSTEMCDALYQRTSSALKIPLGEEAIYLHSTLAETANVILGNAIPDAVMSGEDTLITPPVILEGATRIHHVENAIFASISMTTAQGSLDIHLVGPRNMFDHYLDPVR